MTDPWDPPPFPKHGNRTGAPLFEAIGRALIAWEELETTIAHLFAALKGKSLFDKEANNFYGEPYNFRDRLRGLEQAGRQYFTKYPNQSLEGDLAWIIRYADGYSRRRNDVAHGVVRLLHVILDPSQTLLSGPAEFCLVPPHFREAKFVTPDMPVIILTSREIRRFENGFWSIVAKAHLLGSAVELPKHALRRTFAVPPLWQPPYPIPHI